MGEGINLQTWQFILCGLGFIATCVINTWGVVKYLIGRQDKQTAEVLARIESVRKASVSRDEYTREADQLHREVAGVREAVERQGAANAAQMSQLLLAVGKASKN